MNLIYELNYIVFASFLSLFLMELGIAILSIVSYYEYEHKVRRYLHSMWEINLTFAIFYLVEFEASYPNLLPSIGAIYLAPALAVGVFFIIRNAFVAYSEFIGHPNIEKSYIRVYSLATLIISFIGVSILTSALSGIGIGFQANSINIMQVLFNSFNIMTFVGLVLLVYFIASAYFNEKQNFIFAVIAAIAGVLLIVLALYWNVQYIIQNAMAYAYIVAPLLLMMVLIMFLYRKGHKYTRYVVFAWLFLAIGVFGILQYPYYFGGSLNINAYTTTGATGAYVVLITILGGIFLLAMLGYFFYLWHKNPDDDKDVADSY